MKRVYLTTVMLLMVVSAQAQFDEGTIAVGGGFTFSSENSKTDDDGDVEEGDPITTFGLTPSVGYFIADNLEIGAQIGFTITGQSGNDDVSTVTNRFTIGPYARKYFDLGESVAFFGEAGLMYGSQKTTYKNDGDSSEGGKSSVFKLGISPGVVFRPTDLLGIEFTAGFLGYSSESQEISDDVTQTDSNFGLSFDTSNLTLGLKLYF